jgi:hypothetical protein
VADARNQHGERGSRKFRKYQLPFEETPAAVPTQVIRFRPSKISATSPSVENSRAFSAVRAHWGSTTNGSVGLVDDAPPQTLLDAVAD